MFTKLKGAINRRRLAKIHQMEKAVAAIRKDEQVFRELHGRNRFQLGRAIAGAIIGKAALGDVGGVAGAAFGGWYKPSMSGPEKLARKLRYKMGIAYCTNCGGDIHIIPTWARPTGASET